MKLSAILTAVALPYLCTAITCTIGSQCCGITGSDIDCPCKNNYSPGDKLYPVCQCPDVVTNPSMGSQVTYYYYFDESDSWVNYDHIESGSCDGVPKTCASCTSNCDSPPSKLKARHIFQA